MKKLWILCLLLGMLTWAGCAKDTDQPVSSTTPSFDFLQRVSLDDLRHRVSKKEPMFVYFCWTKQANECVKLQENYLEPNIEYYRWNGLITVVDLDVELPEALEDKSKRSVLTQDFGLRYAPAFVFFYEGSVASMIEWSPENNDVNTGIPVDQLTEWMISVSLIQ